MAAKLSTTVVCAGFCVVVAAAAVFVVFIYLFIFIYLFVIVVGMGLFFGGFCVCFGGYISLLVVFPAIAPRGPTIRCPVCGIVHIKEPLLLIGKYPM